MSLTACAVVAPESHEKAVEKRAAQYWQSRIEGRFDKAYALTSPSFRAVRTAEQYKARFGGGSSIKSAEVVRVTCEEKKCSANMKLVAAITLPVVNLSNITTYLDEPWILEEGSWWRYEDL